jgi:hypothetical protein
MWRPPGSVCSATKLLVGFSRISIQHLLTQVLSQHEFREKRVSGVDIILMSGNKFISVLCIFFDRSG